MSDTGNTTAPCTLQTCPLSEGIITYQPNIGANAAFAALFGICLVAQIILSIRKKAWSFLIAMTFGIILEIVGYIGRIQLHGNPFDFNYFIEYLVCLTIAPAFLCAGIYVTFTRLVRSRAIELPWISARTLSFIFMTSDFLCLVLQAAGGAITSTSGGPALAAQQMRQTGINIMISGLALQVLSLVLFITFAGLHFWKWSTKPHIPSSQKDVHLRRLQYLAIGLTTASVTILIRSAYRVAELRDGFQSALANNEAVFMVLETTMVFIACLALTIAHPGLCLDVPWAVPRHQKK